MFKVKAIISYFELSNLIIIVIAEVTTAAGVRNCLTCSSASASLALVPMAVHCIRGQVNSLNLSDC